MSLFRALLGGVIAVGLAASPAWADRPRDQDRAFKATREGRSMPLPQIERRVMPFMGGAEYLGPEFMGKSYRLKFMRDGRVIWVDVDAATGRIIGRSGRCFPSRGLTFKRLSLRSGQATVQVSACCVRETGFSGIIACAF